MLLVVAMCDLLAIGIDGTENAGEGLKRQMKTTLEFSPKTSRTELRGGKGAKAAGGDSKGASHTKMIAAFRAGEPGWGSRRLLLLCTPDGAKVEGWRPRGYIVNVDRTCTAAEVHLAFDAEPRVRVGCGKI